MEDKKEYPCYKCGLRKWSSFPITSRISLIVSVIALLATFVKEFV